MAYEPTGVPPTNVEDLALFLQYELQRIGQVFGGGVDNILLPELNVAPDRPRTGMIVLADGTNWNPGSGAGFYGYYGGAWVKLG